ncbi:MAG: RimK/LysX family protein [Candidatus Diapherotrites archaeon]|nr:RimK/LysX family protein [Candidatus Diapherotrites archaeon]
MSKKTQSKQILNKPVIGLIEPVKITGQIKTIKTYALVDTGSSRTTVDMEIAAKAGLGPIVKVIHVKKSEGAYKRLKRIVVQGWLEIKGKKEAVEMTVSDRSKFRYPVLLGREALQHAFVIDLQQTHAKHKPKEMRKRKK